MKYQYRYCLVFKLKHIIDFFFLCTTGTSMTEVMAPQHRLISDPMHSRITRIHPLP